MKMQSKVNYKQEVNGMVRQQPYTQQRRIRVLEPSKQPRSSSSPDESESEPTAGPVMSQLVEQYHAKLEGAHELVLEPNEFGLVWGVTHEMPDDDGEFKLRLLQRCTDQQQQQQQQQRQQQLRVKCVEVSRESLDLLCFHEPKIRSLMLAHDKAIIFQNMDVQVYVMEEQKAEGFRVHFQDKRRTKVSLTYQQFLSFISALPRLDSDYLKYKKKLKIKKNKLRAKGLNVLARC